MEDEPASVEPTTGQKTTKVSSIRFEIEFRALLINLYKKQKRDAQKKVWMITYGSACCSMNLEMLHAAGLIVDQCYTVVKRESKYTLIHISDKSKARITNIQKLMTRLQSEHGIITTSIFGFEAITSNAKDNADQLESHPGFQLIVDALNSKRDTLEWWMKTGDLVSNRRGLLWKHLEDTDVTSMTKAQLLKRAREWNETRKENKALKGDLEFLNGQIQEMKRQHEDFRHMADETLHKYMNKSEECNQLMIENARLRSEMAGKGI